MLGKNAHPSPHPVEPNLVTWCHPFCRKFLCLEAVMCVLHAQLLGHVWHFALMDCNLPDTSIHVMFLARTLGGLPFPPSRDLPDPGINPSLLRFLHWQAEASPLSLQVRLQVAANPEGLLSLELTCPSDSILPTLPALSGGQPSVLAVPTLSLLLANSLLSEILYVCVRKFFSNSHMDHHNTSHTNPFLLYMWIIIRLCVELCDHGLCSRVS